MSPADAKTIPTVVNPFYAKSILIVIWPYIQTPLDINAAFVGEALPGGKSAAWHLGCGGLADRSDSDSLNRHVLQHSVCPAKRTPSACQTCRRRKKKCDSNYPCSTCADSGEPCVREPSSVQAFTPALRLPRKGSLGEEKRPFETEQVDPDRTGDLTMPSADDTSPIQPSPMQLDWNPPMDRTASNSIANTCPGSRNVCIYQVPLQPLTDPLIVTMSGIKTATSTPNEIPFYYGEPSDTTSFPYTPVWQPSEARDYFGADQLPEIYMSDVPAFTSSGRFSRE
ncbi:unnamed protein product [Penicillium egyptiacum]|uniref:Zn(2)-C6 fungal-type domain-containing protein n=1 Tax=Penicillium egyptiacum TaxID=1303716 RepID=A0A9W4K6J2_9EURO|nr:unnamed protein product [Penicillium egyptiacum]